MKEYSIDKKRREEKIDRLNKNLPAKMLKYPNQDPSANEMLVKYTIWKDIKVYSTWFDSLENDKEIFDEIISGKFNIPRSPVTNHRLNVYLSIALEAEKRFKSVYVSTNDIRKQIEEKGYYDPPGVMFRFKGPLYIKIRKNK